MLKKPTALKLIFQVILLLSCLIGRNIGAEEAGSGLGSKSLSLQGVTKLVLHVQNSDLKLSQFQVTTKAIKIFSNFNSLLNKVIVKKVKKAGVLHIWIFKNTLITQKKQIQDSASIGKVFIKMPAVPVELTQNLGSTSVEFWKSPLIIKKWDGEINVKHAQSKLNIFSQKGAISIDSYKGHLTVEAYSNKLSINSSEGKMNLNIFSGSVNLNKVRASVSMSNYSASLLVRDMEGSLKVRAENSSMRLEDIKASVNIKLVKGKVKVSKVGAISLNVSSSGSANITVDLQKQAARLSLQSRRFKIRAPKGLKRKVFGRGEQIKGLLPGAGAKAFVVLKSKEGKISLRP